jgi:hypothetical protein
MCSEGEIMDATIFQQLADRAVSIGPVVLVRGLQLQRPSDVVETSPLSVDDKRTILAAWASDLYALNLKPALRQLPGTPEPVSINDVREALVELDRHYHS